MFLYKKTPHPSRFVRHLLPQEKAFYPLFLLQKQAQKKKLSKRKRRYRDFALCGARPPLSVDDTAF